MTEHLVIIFAYHFPPENRIGGARPFRFAKYLSRLGYACRVFTASEQTSGGNADAEYVPDPFATGSARGIAWHLERAARKFYLPGDTGMRWSYHAARAARAHIRKHPGARVTVFSSYPPLGCHLAAWQLVRGGLAGWIADFRDPMRNESVAEHLNSFQKATDRWLEKALLSRADAVIANTEEAAVRWRGSFPSLNGKAHVIWNGFDPESRIPALPIPSREYKVLTHAGELYGGRNATAILESVARLFAEKRLPSGSVRVRLIGPAEATALPSQPFLDRARSDNWLDLITELIPQQDALQAARTSDSLLLLQPQSSTQVPGKLFEYLQIGRPILAFVQPNSPTERILERSGVPYRCVYPDSSAEATDETLAQFFRLPSATVAASPWFEEHFDARRQTNALHILIQSLHGGRTHDGERI